MMRKNIFFTFCLLLGIQQVFSQATAPILCNDGKVHIVMQNIVGTHGISGFYTIDMNNGDVDLIKDPIIPVSTGIVERRINCIGYNETDKFIYGYRAHSNQIIRIDANGNYDLITVPGLNASTVGSATAGDIYNNELYIFTNSNAKLFKINLSTLDVTIIPFTTPISISNFQINDFVFGSDHNIYGITQIKGTNTRRILKIDLTTRALQFLGTALGTQINSEADDSWGTAFLDSQDNLYVGNNGSRNVYKFRYNSATNTYDMNAGLFTTADDAGQVLADGASCRFTLSPNIKDDKGCIIDPAVSQNILINVLNNDIAGTFNIDPSSVRLIDPMTSALSTSVTISGQGTFSVNTATGEITFSSLATFSPPASIQYVVSDIYGNRSNPATITITTCYCTKSPKIGITNKYTNLGISLQQKQDNWPQNIPNGFIALESKEKGFVISRVNHVSHIPQTTDSITDPKEGMIVYDIQDSCVKLFNGINWKCIEKSCND